MTAEYLRSILEYAPETGEFRWKARISQTGKIGMLAGCVNVHGYWFISIHKKRYYGHRLAWLHVHGEWPVGEIDHLNGVRNDNRIKNLRVLTHAQNAQNITRTKKKSKTGVLGVHPEKNGFSSKIMIDRRSIHLGVFKTVEEAHAAYIAAKRKLHEGNTL